ncbi:1-hydroxycarotenoid 3,4-desaturase CrtD [Sediminibacterium sp.]|uniref:1-hydroxycarotenoid 3,4-desaturase CrtD n=1 Tax=Sediminibacterium sp. TaxID=1917865 RepID=UPI0027328B5B|nr:1-hydroxycarotenoid 3,4-desaturase CrtD [Sediminibacterium sp.]MDP3567494.1 phytoene desaturase family protein [Sediminibacterium sp.]
MGAGIGGLASAIRLAKQGFIVTVFEKNTYPGGKLSEITLGKFRFDKGPSLLTMPELIDELTVLSGYKTNFNYSKLKTITHYFFEDGTKIVAQDSAEALAKELKNKLNEDEQVVINHLKKSKFYYSTVADLFINQSLGKIKNFLNLKTLKALLNLNKLSLFSTMHAENSKLFKSKKTTQIFNRYATYNGSNPYKAPALLNIIPHLEFGLGAYLPEKGMHQITEHLYNMALFCGVTFKFNEHVEKIEVENKKVSGLISNGVLYKSALVVSDSDIHLVYKKMLPKKYYPTKLLSQEKSSSAYVFYWGIKKTFPELDLHNILFSENYKAEFNYLFEEKRPYVDPTIYINITSKFCQEDAPIGCENWFVMVNVPHNKSGDSIDYAADLRKNVIAKINRVLKTDIEALIIEEAILDPFDIEQQTSSFGGSLYGNASNNKFSAFLRHANYNNKIGGLYFVGGSVHPGGGIPLCLLSAKIVSNLIEEKKQSVFI